MREQDVQKLQDEVRDIILRKSRDYGTNNIEITGMPGIATRVMDKASRLLNLTKNEREANFESISDTLLDLQGYGIIGQLLLDGTFSEEDPDVVEDDNKGLVQGRLIIDDEPNPFEGLLSAFKPVVSKETADSNDRAENAEEAVGERGSFNPRDIKQTGMVYLCGPIDNVTEEEAKGWRTIASESLAEAGWAAFNPATGVSNGYADMVAVQGICLSAIQHSSAVLAYLPVDYPAFGSIAELTMAHLIGKDVVIVSDWVHRSIFAHPFPIVNTIGEGVEYITNDSFRRMIRYQQGSASEW